MRSQAKLAVAALASLVCSWSPTASALNLPWSPAAKAAEHEARFSKRPSYEVREVEVAVDMLKVNRWGLVRKNVIDLPAENAFEQAVYEALAKDWVGSRLRPGEQVQFHALDPKAGTAEVWIKQANRRTGKPEIVSYLITGLLRGERTKIEARPNFRGNTLPKLLALRAIEAMVDKDTFATLFVESSTIVGNPALGRRAQATQPSEPQGR